MAAGIFAIYGISVEAVTVVVTAFMLGLGLGGLTGGVAGWVDSPHLPPGSDGLEMGQSLLLRLKVRNAIVIADDNMRCEWPR